MEPKPLNIFVTGDPACDHAFYKGERSTADSTEKLGFSTKDSGGGVHLLHDLITCALADIKRAPSDEPLFAIKLGVSEEFEGLPKRYHSYSIWEPHASLTSKDKADRVWRMTPPALGFGLIEERGNDDAEPKPVLAEGKIDVLVIDDAGISWSDQAPRLWEVPDNEVGWVVLKLGTPNISPLLWQRLKKLCAEQIIVVVSAKQLRRGEVRISRGLSWEASVQDLVAELRDNARLAWLNDARHVVVTFESDGAYWCEKASGGSARLVFDVSHAEGEWEDVQRDGGVFGYQTCFTASVVRALCLAITSKPDSSLNLDGALKSGLAAARGLYEFGHGRVFCGGTLNKPAFPWSEVVQCLASPTEKFQSVAVPLNSAERSTWSILEEWQVLAKEADCEQPQHIVAQAVARQGPSAIHQLPMLTMGNLTSIDRGEIESLRTIRKMIRDYDRSGPQRKPLSIGVFGPPGSGKSFIVEEITKALFHGAEPMTFNLSQFSDSSELNGAFQQVRDMCVRGKTPVVFWDEFDSQKFKWLQYLLAPMQDGSFQDGQINHPIGKCVFVFAGATSTTYETFGPIKPSKIDPAPGDPVVERDIASNWRDFELKKGPDFISRLSGFLDILGPNRRENCREVGGRRVCEPDKKDLCFPIRRALFIRGVFRLKDGEELKLDDGVLRALLEIEKYESGARSLQFICTYLIQNSERTPQRSQMPADPLLRIHVNAVKFWGICERDSQFLAVVEDLASLLHHGYLTGAAADLSLPTQASDLSSDKRASNLAQAMRIPDNLRLVGMDLVQGAKVDPSTDAHGAPIVDDAELVSYMATLRTPEETQLLAHLQTNLEFLAEAEHNGWMVERLLKGWQYGDKKTSDVDVVAGLPKRNPSIVPYYQLAEEIKDFDRHAIVGSPERLGYIDLVKLVGLRVVAKAVERGEKT